MAEYTNPHEYVNFNDFDANANLTQSDNFVISDSTGTTPLGIDDGDTFRLEMDDTGNLIAEIVLE